MGGGAYRSGCGPTSRRRWISAATWRRRTKRDRALVLMLAAAELLVRGGERVALLGLTQPTASRKATTRIAEAILAHARGAARSGEPAAEGAPGALSRARCCSAISSIRSPRHRARIEAMAADGVAGHLVADPRSRRGDAALRGPHGVPAAPTAANAGSPIASRACARNIKERLAAHRAEIVRVAHAARLVVPRASHRPAGVRAAADADHAAAGRRRRSPLARHGTRRRRRRGAP